MRQSPKLKWEKGECSAYDEWKHEHWEFNTPLVSAYLWRERSCPECADWTRSKIVRKWCAQVFYNDSDDQDYGTKVSGDTKEACMLKVEALISSLLVETIAGCMTR